MAPKRSAWHPPSARPRWGTAFRPLRAIRRRAPAGSSVGTAQGAGQLCTYLVYQLRAAPGARPRVLGRGRADHRATATRPVRERVAVRRVLRSALQTALTFKLGVPGRSLQTGGRGAGAPREIDALTPRPARGLPVPCNYLTALTESRNLRETPVSSLVSGGRKGNKEAF